MSKTPRSFVVFSVGSDVAVIFNNDANQWVEYVKNHLKKLDQSRDSVHVSINEDHDLFPRPHPNTLASLQNAKVIVVIASPGFLANLQRDEKRSCWIEDPTNAILFLCGVTEEDVRVSGLTSRFHSFDEWTKITHDKPEELFRHITASIDDFDNKSLPRDTTKARGSGASVASGDVGAPTPVAAGIETTAATDNDTSWVFDITPTVIHAEEQTEVIIFFQNELPVNSQLKIVIDDVKLPVHRRNPYTGCFFAPEHREGNVETVLECDGFKVGQLTLKYTCEMEKMNGLIQIHLQALELICQKKGINSKELDKTLSKIFMDKSDAIPAAAFEILFGMHEYAASMSIKHELPTLLHFAAKYGLKDFTCHLIDLPGALLAYSISNRDGDRPAEIARNHSHGQLANYFDSYIEMNGALYELMEPYMYFSIESLSGMQQPTYYNTHEATCLGYDQAIPVGMTATQDDYYMDMRLNKHSSGYTPVNTLPTKKAPKPTLVPKTPRQRELYDIIMRLYENKMTALETKRRITEWFSKHAVGTSLKDKQKNLDELKHELKMWASEDREHAGYVRHSNKGEFVLYMLRQCMRQHTSPGYINALKSPHDANVDDHCHPTNEREYMYTDTVSAPEPSDAVYEANPSSLKRLPNGGLSVSTPANSQKKSSPIQRHRPSPHDASVDDHSHPTNEREYMYTDTVSAPEPSDAVYEANPSSLKRLPNGGLSMSTSGNSQKKSSPIQRYRPVSMRMDKLIELKGIDPIPAVPKRQVKPPGRQREEPPTPSVPSPLLPNIPKRAPKSPLS